MRYEVLKLLKPFLQTGNRGSDQHIRPLATSPLISKIFLNSITNLVSVHTSELHWYPMQYPREREGLSYHWQHFRTVAPKQSQTRSGTHNLKAPPTTVDEKPEVLNVWKIIHVYLVSLQNSPRRRKLYHHSQKPSTTNRESEERKHRRSSTVNNNCDSCSLHCAHCTWNFTLPQTPLALTKFKIRRIHLK